MYTPAFATYFPICVQLDIGDLRLLLLSVHEFRENRLRKGLVFVIGVPYMKLH